MSGLDVDVLRFDRLAAAGATAGTTSDDGSALDEAAALYESGPLLEGWTDAWVVAERTRRRERYIDVLRRLAQRALDANNPAAAAKRLHACVDLNPSEERAWRDLIYAQAAAGERVAALQTYERYRAYLHSQGKGLQPPPETTALYTNLLAGMTPPDPAARQAGAVTAITDFEALAPADADHSLDALCRYLATQLAAQLDLDIVPETVWKPLLGPGVNLERFVIRHVLEQVPAPLVWALDGADRLFSLPFGGEFFSLLRTWHEKRALEPLRPWRRLTVALACATEAHLYIRDLNKSPFNVGTRVELGDFCPEQVADLNRRYGRPLQTSDQVARFVDLVGGHPYLVRRGLHEMATQDLPFTDLVARAADEEGPFGDHLRRLARRLLEDPDLAQAARDTLQNKPCSPESFFRLRSAGVLAGDHPGSARPRCCLYAMYLASRL